jgi:hypothetical protein
MEPFTRCFTVLPVSFCCGGCMIFSGPYKPSANAAMETWTQSCSIILCWPHIKLNAGKNNKSKLRDTSLADVANEQITYVHCSRSTPQFEKLLILLLIHWRDGLGERDFADWFEAEYGQFPWLNWHAGFTANNK